MTFATGDNVLIECDGRTVAGHVVFASSNGKSLMLGFEALLDGHVGMMPVLLCPDGVYRSVVNAVVVSIRPLRD